MKNEALIHMRVPAALKARWVRESQTAGMRLTDWIVQRVEAQMPKPIQIVIPAISFADLKLARDADGHVSFDMGVVAQIERASGLPEGYFMGQPEDLLAGVIARWYASHRAAGGEPDPVYEDLADEVRLEDSHGAGLSHPPGRA